jgi:hypothetical protein
VDEDKNARAVNEALNYLAARRTSVGAGQYSADHKGTPFYILGYAAFGCHDYMSAGLYFDAAVEADLRFHNGNINTPALRFIQLLHDPREQLLATNVIAEIEVAVELLLTDYRGRQRMQHITLQDLRTRFFQNVLNAGPPHRRTLLTAFISFVAEWPYRKKQFSLVEEGSREPFFLHIFRGCLLFESLLKNAPGVPALGTLGRALHHYQSALQIRGPVVTAANSFNDIVQGLSANMDIDHAILSCAQTRNKLGHNLVWETPDLNENNYDWLVKNVAVSCIHAISKLYP